MHAIWVTRVDIFFCVFLIIFINIYSLIIDLTTMLLKNQNSLRIKEKPTTCNIKNTLMNKMRVFILSNISEGNHKLLSSDNSETTKNSCSMNMFKKNTPSFQYWHLTLRIIYIYGLGNSKFMVFWMLIVYAEGNRKLESHDSPVCKYFILQNNKKIYQIEIILVIAWDISKGRLQLNC